MNLSYAAGFIDGEGCIGFTQCRGRLVPRLLFKNTDLPILQEFQSKFGGRIQKGTRTKTVKSHWKQCFHWVLTGTKAVDFCDKISNKLKIKLRQAQCLFAFSAIQPGKGGKWDKDGIEACKLLSDQIHWLNKKGIHNDPEPVQVVLEQRG